MFSAVRTPARDRMAMVSSIALHCCAIVALATVGKLTLAPDAPDERTIRASLIRIDRRPPAPAIHRAGASPRVAPLAAPPLRVARLTSASTKATFVQAEHRYRTTGLQRASVAAPKAVVAMTRAAMVAPVAAPAATSGPASVAAATTEAAADAPHDYGIGNFGENYPAKVDPQARGTLFAGVADAVLMRVEVDENGRVIALVFLRAPADATLKEELRSRVLAAHFIPAACNGLRCSDTIDVRSPANSP